ncbi:MAG TPA: DUF2277 family protein [Mycobacteriales bacterium]|jgi:hypothetical protein|nr:DUF2277 family protein [Mycobacteriales bacterium]
MCRSIKTLRPPYVDSADRADVEAAALQYVRKIAGMRAPSAANAQAFDAAVAEVADATARLLAGLTVRAAPARRSATAE